MPRASFEKSVKGATKSKNAAPKSKYIEHILSATYSDAGLAEVFRTIQIRLRESTWTVVFKTLIVIHMMIREGSPSNSLSYISQNARNFAITSISDAQLQGANIWRYSEYIISRSVAYSETKTDYVRSGSGRLKTLRVSRGLLRETEIVQKQIKALLKCDLLRDEPENEITLTAFRLITLDLLTLYSVMNEGVINVLEHYFEMSRPDSERALDLYKTFSKLTEDVVSFLRVARQFEHATRLEIPNLKHASTDLAKLLEDDLNDPDFNQRRKEYQEQKFGKSKAEDKAEKASGSKKATFTSNNITAKPATSNAQKDKSSNMIDFFAPIEQPTQPVQQQQQYLGIQNPQMQQFQQPGQPLQQPVGLQQNNFQQPMVTGVPASQNVYNANPLTTQNTNPFAQFDSQTQQQQLQLQQQSQPPQLQPLQLGNAFTGLGNFTVPLQTQPSGVHQSLGTIPQNGVTSFLTPTQTGSPRPNNPFRQSMLVQDGSSVSTPSPFPSSTPLSPPPSTALKRRSTNPFAKPPTFDSPFANNPVPQYQTQPQLPQQLPQQPQQLQQQQQQLQPLMPNRTGTNPFARDTLSPLPQPVERPVTAPLRPNLTGSTNPFRQSAFIDQNTGMGWQHSQQGTIGGLEKLESIPVFPRPGQMA